MTVAISGTGIVSPIAVGTVDFSKALKSGNSNFTIVQLKHLDGTYRYPGALINNFDFKKEISQLLITEEMKKGTRRMRNISVGGQHGIYAALEAWTEARLAGYTDDPGRIAIISSGSNTQQATLYNIQERYREKLNFINPTYGFGFLDTDIIGAVSELLDIRGGGHSVGAASASGNMAIIEGCRMIECGDYDIVLVVAPSMELSVYEYQGFTALGAMAPLEEGSESNIEECCVPFDESHSGFVFGQNAGAIVLESDIHARSRGREILSYVAGYGCSTDGNRNPNPSAAGEARAMQNALNKAGISIDQIDYISTHGTASAIGDKAEVEAILSLGREGIKANATKGLIGHGISAAGVVETIACIAQMKGGFLHPNPSLKNPVNNELDWAGEVAISAKLEYVMNNSYGFGGINTSIILKNHFVK